MKPPIQRSRPLTCAQIRAIDRHAIETLGLPGVVLMENAGRGAAEFVCGELFDPASAIVAIFCGPGNNGGDGFVIARHLMVAGVDARVVLAAAPERLRGDAAVHFRVYEAIGGRVIRVASEADLGPVREAVSPATMIVDALLGTGSSGPPRGMIAACVRIANEARGARRIAIDVPTGLDADTGAVAEPCFRADATVTFVAQKIGFGSAAAQAVLGRIVVVGIGVPALAGFE